MEHGDAVAIHGCEFNNLRSNYFSSKVSFSSLSPGRSFVRNLINIVPEKSRYHGGPYFFPLAWIFMTSHMKTSCMLFYLISFQDTITITSFLPFRSSRQISLTLLLNFVSIQFRFRLASAPRGPGAASGKRDWIFLYIFPSPFSVLWKYYKNIFRKGGRDEIKMDFSWSIGVDKDDAPIWFRSNLRGNCVSQIRWQRKDIKSPLDNALLTFIESKFLGDDEQRLAVAIELSIRNRSKHRSRAQRLIAKRFA